MGVERPSHAMMGLLDVLVATTAELVGAVAKLRSRDYPGIFAAKARIRTLEKQGDRVHRDAVSRLFLTGEIDVKVLLRERIVLDDIETAVDHCEIVADTLSNLAVKHG